MKTRWKVLAATALLASCGPERADKLAEPLEITQLDVGDRLAFLNRATGQSIIIDPVREDGPALSITSTTIGEAPGASAVASDAASFYTVDEESETLVVVDPATGERSEVQLDSPFDRMEVDPEGEFVLLYFSGQSDENVVARNLNEIGIVDLRGSTPEATFLTLASRPLAITFAPPFEIGGERTRMAAVASRNEVTFLDLEELDDVDEALREVPLTISEADAARVPADIQFDVTPTEEDPDVIRAYILTDESNDVTEVSIQPSILDEAERKFDLSVNQLAAGTAPGAMRLLELEAGSRLVALSRTLPEFTVVDVASGESATFALPLATAAQNMLVYRTTVEVAGEPKEELRILAYSRASLLVAVIRPETIAVAGDEPTLGRSVEAIRLEKFPERVEFSDQQPDRAIVFHPGNRAGFTILDLRKNNDIPIQGGSLNDIHFDGDFAYAVYRSLDNMTIFGLDGHPINFELPYQGDDVFYDVEDDLIVVRHPGESGIFTVLDGSEPTPDNARVYYDVFLQNVLDLDLDEIQPEEVEE